MKQPLTLIKLGGSVITNKSKQNTLHRGVLSCLAKEIALAQNKTGEKYIVGHGQGSFAHIPAKKYQVMDGFVRDDSKIGMAKTQNSVMQLNRLVVKEFLSQDLPAVSWSCSNALVTAQQEADNWSLSVLQEYLNKGMLPITGGDVMVDKKQGCTVWSTEKVLGHIANHLPTSSNFQIKRVIQVTNVPGVLDASGEVVKNISQDNLAAVKTAISETNGTDVTGGMWHKITQSLKLAERGISTMIISGLQANNLYNCLVNQQFVGTTISSNEQDSTFSDYRAPAQLVS